MSQVVDIIQAARTFASRQGWSKSKLSISAGLSKNTLRNLDDADVEFESSTLIALEKFLHSQNMTNKGAKSGLQSGRGAGK